jgi:hypothetical protein
MEQLSLADQQRGVTFIATVEQLLMLDDLWTHHMESGRADDADVEILDAMASRIIQLLSEAAPEVAWVNDLASRDAEATARVMQTFIEKAPLDASGRQDLGSRLLSKPGLVEAIGRASRELPSRVEMERQGIEQKMARMRGGQPSGGDLAPETRCFLQGAVCGATAGLALVTSSAAEGVFAAYQAVELASSCF